MKVRRKREMVASDENAMVTVIRNSYNFHRLL